MFFMICVLAVVSQVNVKAAEQEIACWYFVTSEYANVGENVFWSFEVENEDGDWIGLPDEYNFRITAYSLEDGTKQFTVYDGDDSRGYFEVKDASYFDYYYVYECIKDGEVVESDSKHLYNKEGYVQVKIEGEQYVSYSEPEETTLVANVCDYDGVSVDDIDDYTFQWYILTSDDSGEDDWNPIEGATSQEYTTIPDKDSSHSYLVVVNNVRTGDSLEDTIYIMDKDAYIDNYKDLVSPIVNYSSVADPIERVTMRCVSLIDNDGNEITDFSNYTFQWYYDDEKIEGATDYIYTGELNGYGPEWYFLRVYKNGKLVGSELCEVWSIKRVEVNANTNFKYASIGDTITFKPYLVDCNSNDIDDISGYRFQWYKYDENAEEYKVIDDADSIFYSFKINSSEDFGEYRLNVFDEEGKLITDEGWFYCKEKPAIYEMSVDLEGNNIKSIGDEVKLQAKVYDYDGNEVTDLSGYTIQWYKEGEEENEVIEGANEASYDFTLESEDQFGYYGCFLKNVDELECYSNSIGIYDKDAFGKIKIEGERYVSLGDQVTLKAVPYTYGGEEITDVSDMEFQWYTYEYECTDPIVGANSEEYTITVTQENLDSVSYDVRVTYHGEVIGAKYECYDKDHYVDYFVDAPTEAKVGDQITLTCKLTDYQGNDYNNTDGSYTFTWKKFGDTKEKYETIGTDQVISTILDADNKNGDFILIIYKDGKYFGKDEVNIKIRDVEEAETCNHEAEVVAAVAATCTTTGLTEGSVCSICGEVLKEQEVIPATGHIEVIDQAVAATQENTGPTEGSHCSVCGEVIKAQEVIPVISGSDEEKTEADKEKDTDSTEKEVCVHSYGAWKVSKAATVFRKGQKVRTCKTCGASEKKAIAKLKPRVKLSAKKKGKRSS